jgi:hypothetical protein
MRFDPEFDDTRWTGEWLTIPFVQIPPGRYMGGYVVRREMVAIASICDRPYQLLRPLDCRGLYDPAGLLWMSDTPQERLMMHNNALASGGRILVGGLGLGLYPQYVASRAQSITVVERSPDVAAIVWPVIEGALAGTQLQLILADIETFLGQAPTTQYDTIFLDTWEALDATRLPHVNRLRDLAYRHLSPTGQVLLWGYRWMVRLFEVACLDLLSQPPIDRAAWLARRTHDHPAAAALLTPVQEQFASQDVTDLDRALAWCCQYVTTLVYPRT